MNVHDSERMAGLLEQAGYEPTDDDRDADVIVINTCSVRERAEEKLFTRLGEIRQLALEDRHRGRSSRSPDASRSRKASAILRALVRPSTSSSARRTSSGCRCSSTTPSTRAGTRRADRRPRSARRRVVSAGDCAAARSGQGVRHHHRGLQRVLRLLRRPVHARPRAHAAGRRHPRGRAARGRRPARSEVQLLGQIVNHYQAPDDPACDFAGAARAAERRRRARRASASPARIRGTSRRG